MPNTSHQGDIMSNQTGTDRLSTLERQVRWQRRMLVAGILVVGVMGFRRQPTTSDEVRTRRLVVVDDSGRARVVIDQDPATTDRRSRSAGVTLYDSTGAERGGMSTMDDGGVVMALDAPMGVGSPMRDRIGLVVNPDGSSYVMLIDNETRAVAKLQSDGKGGGGVQVFKWEESPSVVRIRTLTYDGERRDSAGFSPQR
jgi:hypothetical protein